LQQHHAQTAENPLGDDQAERGDAEPAQPGARFLEPKRSGQDDRQESHRGRNQTMAMFRENSADHFRPRVEKHIVTEAGRPIGDGEPRAFAGDQAADEKQWNGRARERDREPLGPR
jgi:hypothetical protein